MSNKRTSNYLILIGAILLVVNAVTVFLVYRTIKNLRDDARIINETGTVRGLIQRISKIETSGITKSEDKIFKEVDDTLNSLLSKENPINAYRHHDDSFYKYVSEVSSHWEVMKNLYTDYRKNPTLRLKEKIINESETCWETADAAVLQAQIYAENKIWGIRLFYFILLVFALSTILVIWIVYSYVRNKLEYQAAYDSLTGLLNRYSYDTYIEEELERSQRYQHPLSIILLDLDHFKQINDNFGHKTGDRVLAQVASIMKSSIRKSDSLFRVGGEEFALVTPESSAKEAYHLAEKIRKIIEESFEHSDPKVTISLGISECVPDRKCSEIYREADEALYRAKNNGRNKVEIYQSS